MERSGEAWFWKTPIQVNINAEFGLKKINAPALIQ